MMDKNIYVTKSSMPSYEEYIEAIKPLWDSHVLTNMGRYHQCLEKELQKYLQVEEVSLMVNGHMALEMTIQAFDFPEGSEVITSPFTFVSTIHAIVRNGLKPVFCDVKSCDGTIDEKKIETLISNRTVAILPIHVYGNICHVEKIQEIADKYGLKVIYDAAHAFGVQYKNRGIGSFGDASCFSFHATKVFNTIEGGAVTFRGRQLYERLYNLKNFGIRGEELVVDVGANAKMNEFCAIMGLCNLKHLPQALAERKRVAKHYCKRLHEINGIEIFRKYRQSKDYTDNYSYFPILVKDEYGITRDELYDRLKRKGIYSRKYFYPLASDQVCFEGKYLQDDLVIARSISSQVLVLPMYEELKTNDVDRICDVISMNSLY